MNLNNSAICLMWNSKSNVNFQLFFCCCASHRTRTHCTFHRILEQISSAHAEVRASLALAVDSSKTMRTMEESNHNETLLRLQAEVERLLTHVTFLEQQAEGNALDIAVQEDTLSQCNIQLAELKHAHCVALSDKLSALEQLEAVQQQYNASKELAAQVSRENEQVTEQLREALQKLELQKEMRSLDNERLTL
jgi:hypothetical protein